MASILVVEDDVLSAKALDKLCQQAGMTAATVGDGQAALEYLSCERVDLVLLDIHLPVVDGFEVLQRIRAWPEADKPAIVIISSVDGNKDKRQGLELGAVDFVEKPFRGDDLLLRVNRVLVMTEMERRLRDAERALAALRSTDSVTGTGTFGQLNRTLDAAFQYPQAIMQPLSCVALSDDGYSDVLEAGGLEAGEARLRSITAILQERLRRGDSVFRLDMAEFVILMPGTPAEGATVALRKVREAVLGLPGVEESHIVTASATYPHRDIQHASQLFRATTLTLAIARSSAGDRIGFFAGFM